ncbi:MAG: ATP-binding cassette domain-containing protein [Rhizobacter sp.]|nr:ATP-binding cassette domain-containing protein [Chlorobiales bacterium]
MPPVITVKNLNKTYRIFKKQPGLAGAIKSFFNRQYEPKIAVDNVSFDIAQGELVGFLGANGAGKTTTLKMLAGLLNPTSGDANVLGFTPHERKNNFRKQFSIVLGQKNQLWWDLPAMDSFLLLKEIYEIDDAAFHAQIKLLTELLDVVDKLGVQLRRLSLGERMKMELIGSLLHAPKVLFLDEPTIGLDVVAQKSIREFIKTYNREQQTTILLTSHYMQDIEELCQRVIIIDAGKLFFDGPLTDISGRFNSEKVLTLAFSQPVSLAELSRFGRITDAADKESDLTGDTDAVAATATLTAATAMHVSLRVDRTRISEISAAILSRFAVHDLNIEEVPIEDIIRNIFAKK